MSKKLTIILTLKDRIDFTYRWMQYMNDIKCPYQIFIADGGADKNIEEHLEKSSNYPFLNYTYIRYPYDQNFEFYYTKLTDIVERVTTPYLIFADNDDFFLLEYFPEFMKFLNENPEFVSCGGTPIELSLLSKENLIINSPAGSNYLASMHNQPQSIEQDSVAQRISYFFENVEKYVLWWAYYNILRTTAAKKSFNFLKHYKFKEIVAFEIHIHLTLLAAGKYKGFNFPFYIRQSGTSQLTQEVNAGNNLIERFIGNNTFLEIQKSIDSISNEISEEDKRGINNALSQWFANTAIVLYSKVPVNAGRNCIKRLFQNSNRFWFFYTFKLMQQAAKTLRKDKKRYIRLPAIEKYIMR